MGNNRILPNDDVNKKLHSLVKDYYKELKSLPAELKHIPLTSLSGLWDKNSDFKTEQFDQWRDKYKAAGIDGEHLYKIFTDKAEEIFQYDEHLSICCGGITMNLATAIDLFCLKSIYNTETFLNENISKELLNKFIDSFIKQLYENQYMRSAIFHLFNLEVKDVPKLKIGEWKIINIPQQNIPMILGESTPFSRLHFPDVGNYFLLFEDRGQPNDSVNWIKDLYQQVVQIEGILQFVKDEIINIDYYTFYFTPNWVNQIWRMGNFYYGNIRSINPRNKYTIGLGDLGVINRYWSLYEKNKSKFDHIDKNNLGQVIRRAIRHFQIYHTKDNKEEKFLNLIFALEVLFSPGQELTYRISLCAAIFLDHDNKANIIFDFIKKMLNIRNQLVHGGYDLKEIEQDRFIIDDDLYKLASIIRRAILGFIILYLRGETTKDSITEKIQSCIFNFEERSKLIKSTNLDNYIEENPN